MVVVGYLVAVIGFFLVDGPGLVQLYTGIGLPARTITDLMLIAHRGDLDRYPENTAESILAAAELPLEGIEFDVHQAADGSWWVIHDPFLDRTTTGSGAIHRLDAAVIAEVVIDGGFGFDPKLHDGLRVPRLTDVLELLEDYRGRLYVDLQHARSADAAALAELLDERATILCRDLVDARAVKAANPAVETIVRFGSEPVDASLDGWLAEAVREATIGNVRSSTLPVTTYLDEWRFQDDEAPAIRRAWAANVVAFITKQPETALATRDALREAAATVP